MKLLSTFHLGLEECINTSVGSSEDGEFHLLKEGKLMNVDASWQILQPTERSTVWALCALWQCRPKKRLGGRLLPMCYFGWYRGSAAMIST